MGHHGHYSNGHSGNISQELDQSVRDFIRRHKKGLKIALLLGAILAVLLFLGMAGGLVWGAGYLKNYLAGKSVPVFPMRWEQQIGDASFSQLRAQTRFVTDPAVLDPLTRLARPLLDSLPDKTRKYSLYVADSGDVNACALPGGYVVFNRGLLQKARSPEEIQGVLAHEVAHIQLRHSLMQLAQNLALSAVIGQFFGGENQYVDALVRDGAILLTLKFSRDHERAADDEGWNLLQKARINPRGMADFFAALAAEAPQAGNPAAALLRTHPAPLERIQRLQQKSLLSPPEGFHSEQVAFEELQKGFRAK